MSQQEFDWYQSKKEDVGGIGNYYGGLSIAKVDGKFYWSIENYNGDHPEEITEELYDALKTFKQQEQNPL
jgi:hypothetical protein